MPEFTYLLRVGGYGTRRGGAVTVFAASKNSCTRPADEHVGKGHGLAKHGHGGVAQMGKGVDVHEAKACCHEKESEENACAYAKDGRGQEGDDGADRG